MGRKLIKKKKIIKYMIAIIKRKYVIIVYNN